MGEMLAKCTNQQLQDDKSVELMHTIVLIVNNALSTSELLRD